MADLLVKKIPLPVARPALEDPNGVNPEYWASITSRMPPQGPTEAAGAFNGGEWYYPTSLPVKPLYGLLIESVGVLAILATFYWRKEIWTFVSGIYTRLQKRLLR